MKTHSKRKSCARKFRHRRTTLALVVAALLTHGGPAGAIVAITRQAVGGTTCEANADEGNSVWNTSNDARCHPAAGTGASGVGDPGTNIIIYSTQGTTGTENSITVGGYMDVWQTATFWGGVDMQNTAINNLAPGAADTDAVNVGQLRVVTNALGGGAAINPDGSVTGPTYQIGSTTYTSVSGALGSLNTSVNGGGGIKYFHTNSSDVDSSALGGASVAIGPAAVASGGFSQAMGGNALSAGDTSLAIGDRATVTAVAVRGVALGPSAVVSADTGVALGNGASAAQAGAVALGAGAVTAAAVATTGATIGDTAYTFAGGAPSSTVSIGTAASQRTLTNLAAGRLGTTSTDAVNGSQLNATNLEVGALDDRVDTLGGNVASALGGGATYNAATGALGAPAYQVGGTTYNNVGGAITSLDTAVNGGGGIKYFHANSTDTDSSAQGTASVAIGPVAVASAGFSQAIGGNALAAGSTSVAIGDRATTTAAALRGVALGPSATVGAENGVALGSGASAAQLGAVALGAGAVTAAAVATTGATIADTAYTFAGGAPSSTVSIGTSTVQRTLTNLAAGRLSTTSTDAVNGSQLNATNLEMGALDDRVDTLGTDVAGALGGGAVYNAATGDVTAPSYQVGATTYNNVGNAISAINSSLTAIGDGGIKYFHTNSTDVDSSAQGTASTAIGPAAVAAAGFSQAMGGNALAAGDTSIAIGDRATVTAGSTRAMAVGPSSTASATNAVALGNGATAGQAGAIALGSASVTAAAVGTTGTTLAGTAYTFAGGAPTSTVSIGSASNQRTLTNLAAGRISATSTDGINGSQLFATNQAVESINTQVGAADDKVDALGSGTAAGLGGGATYDPATGALTSPSYSVGGTTVNNVGAAVTNLDGRTTSNTTAITNLGDAINNGTTGLVQQNPTTRQLTVGAATDGTLVNFTGTAGTRVLTGVSIGAVTATSTDAINGSQLFAGNTSIAAALGGGSVVNPNGTLTAPSYQVGGTTYNTVGGALDELDNRIDNVAAGATKYFHANSTLADSAAGGLDSVAVGPLAVASDADAVALGHGATAGQAGAVALGAASVTAAAVATTGTTLAGTAYTFAGGAPTSTVSIGTSGSERTLTNLAAGRISATSTDGINGSQLFATNQAVESINTQVGAADDKVDALGSGTAAGLGGGATYDPATGALTSPSYSVGGTTVNNVGAAITNLDGRTTSNTTAITNLGDAINNGTTGLVQQNPTNRQLTVGAATDGTLVNFTGTAGTRVLTGVSIGAVTATSTDAINGSQLFAGNTSIAAALGGGSVVNPNGTLTAPSYQIGGTTYNTVGDALDTLDSRIDDVAVGATKYFHANSTLADSTSSGTDSVAVGPVASATGANTIALGNGAQAADAGAVALGSASVTAAAVGTTGTTLAGTAYTFAGGAPTSTVSIGSASNQRTLTNLAAGRISATSTDGINGSQLFATNQAVESINTQVGAADDKVDALGSGTAAGLGGGATYDPATGTLTSPSYSVGGTTVNNVGGAITNLDGRTTSNTTAITNLGDAINSGTTGLVQQNPTTRQLTVGAATDGTLVNFTGTAGTRVLTGVSIGAVTATSTDAINGSQLFAGNTSIAAALGGGSVVNPNGTLTAPSYQIGGTTYTTVGGALDELDNRIDDVAVGATKYFHANSTLADSTSSGADSVAVGPVAAATGTDSIALGRSATAAQVGAVALGSASVTAAAVATPSGTLAGTTYTYAGGAPASTVSIGASGSERTLTNLAAGRISATSTDGINGSQLFATNQAVESINTQVGAADDKVDALGSGTAAGLGGGAAYDPATGALTPPSYSVGGTTVANTGDAITNLDGRTTSNTTAITNLGDAINNGTTGLVQQNPTTRQLTVGTATDGTLVNFTGTAGTRVLTGVSIGAVTATSTDAITGSQLFAGNTSIAAALGGGSVVNPDGTVSAPGYQVGGTVYQSVGDAIGGIDVTLNSIAGGAGVKYFRVRSSAADASASGADSLAAGALANAEGNSATALGHGAAALSNDTVALGHGAVAGVSGGNSGETAVGANAQATADNAAAFGAGATATQVGAVALGAGAQTAAAVATPSGVIAGTTYAYAGAAPASTVSIGAAGAERTLTQLAAGRVSATSTDAVNGSQLYATHQAVEATGLQVGAVGGKVDALGGAVAQGLGGGAAYDAATGSVSAPTYHINGTDFDNVGDALSHLAIGGVQSIYFHANSILADSQAQGTDSVPSGRKRYPPARTRWQWATARWRRSRARWRWAVVR